MSMRVEGPTTCRKSMFSTKSAATMSIARTLPVGLGRDEIHPTPARPHVPDRECVGIERDEVGARTRSDAAAIAHTEQARGVCSGETDRARRNESKGCDIAHGFVD